MTHTFHKCTCNRAECPICQGHTKLCLVCNGVDGLLTTDCCGRTLTHREAAVIGDTLDFIAGEWVRKGTTS